MLILTPKLRKGSRLAMCSGDWPAFTSAGLSNASIIVGRVTISLSILQEVVRSRLVVFAWQAHRLAAPHTRHNRKMIYPYTWEKKSRMTAT